MIKFEAKNFKPGNYAIEASAGTGKTYNIIEIVKKLVNKLGYNLSEILIVTYTEKATGELKERIRKELADHDTSNANIYTIHSFCQHSIAEFGISADLPLNMNVINDDALEEFVKRYTRQSKVFTETLPLFASKFNFEVFVEFMILAIKKYYLNSKYEEDKSIVSIEKFSDVEEFYNEYLDIKDANSIEAILNKFPEVKENYDVFLKSETDLGKAFKEELDAQILNSFDYDGNKFKSSSKWLFEEKNAFKFFFDLKKGIKDINKHHFFVKRYLKDFYKAWQKEKELNKYQAFNDMLRNVREAVLSNDNQLKDKLRAKYRYAIIDEFQDTNQLQFDIFKNVFMCEGHNLIVVGDPKQSIYAFQGADVNVYLEAKKVIEENGGTICKLGKNYRSTPDMVSSCNKLFSGFDFHKMDFEYCEALNEKADKKEHKVIYKGKKTPAIWMGLDGCTDSTSFAEAVVGAIVDCCTFENGKTRLMVKDKDDKEYRNVSFKDFAVLSRTRFEMPAIEYALRQAGIPYMRYKDTGLFKGKECIDWIVLFKAINAVDFNGSNRRLFKKALFTRFFNKPLKDIADDKYNSDDNYECSLIKKWRELANLRRWEDLVDDIIVGSGIMDRMKSLSEIQSLGVYKQIGNYCVDYLSQNHSISDLIYSLEELGEGISDDEEGGSIVEKSTDFNCVQILTMHASKGLQFPIVIGFAGFSKPAENYIHSYHNEADKSASHILGFKLPTAPKLDSMADEIFDNDMPIVVDEYLEEYKRLFYVGYTRAQFVMMLPNSECIHDKLDFVKQALDHILYYDVKEISPTELDLKELKPSVQKILKESSLDNHEDPNAKEAQDNVLKQIIKMSKEISSYKHSYTSLSHSKVENNEYDEEWNNTEGIELDGLSAFDKSAKRINTLVEEIENYSLLPDNYPRGSRCGTALHEIFERIDFTDYENNIEYIIKDSFINQGIKLDDELVSPTINMIDHVLNAKLPTIKGSNVSDDTFTLSSLTSADVKKELEFNFNLNNERLKNFFNGFIDLLFKHNGCYSILDWKSDKLNDDFISYCDNKEMKKHVDDTYSIQRVLYSYCLIKWLKCYYSDLSEEEIFNTYFGGIYYVFLRGCKKETGNGIYCQTWDNFDDLNKEFQNIMTHRIWRKSNE